MFSVKKDEVASCTQARTSYNRFVCKPFVFKGLQAIFGSIYLTHTPSDYAEIGANSLSSNPNNINSDPILQKKSKMGSDPILQKKSKMGTQLVQRTKTSCFF
jgi:hypothetical protein